MAMEILTILKANIRHKKGTFLSLFILMLIIVTAMTAIFNTTANENQAIEQALQQVNAGDLVVFIDKGAYTNELQTSLLAQDTVEQLMTIPAFWTEASEANGTKSYETAFLRTLAPDYRILNENLTTYETETPALEAGEIYVPLGVRNKYACEIGDTIHYTTSFGEYDFVVKGFIEEPINGSASMGWKQIFISDSDFAQMEQDYRQANADELYSGAMYILYIYKASGCTLSDVKWKQQLNIDTGIIDTSMGSLTKTQIIHYTGLFNQIISSILMVFLCLLFIIVLIVIGHSLSTSIELDYVNFGILKAQGFTTRKLQVVLLLQYLLAEIAGAVLGLFLSIPLTAVLVQLYLPVTAILAEQAISPGKSLLCILALLLISIIILLLLTQKLGTLSPVRALSAGQPEQYFDSRFRLPVSPRLLSGSLAFRQFTSAAKRYLASILIVAILVFFMLTINALANMVNIKSTLEAMGYLYSDCSIHFQQAVSEQELADMEAVIETISPIDKIYYLHNRYVSINGYEIYCFVWKNPDMIGGIIKGRAPLYDNEVLITEIVAQELDLELGDTVSLSCNNFQEEYIISGFYQSTNDTGLVISISAEGGAKLDIPCPTSADFSLLDSSKAQEITDTLNKEFGNMLEAEAVETDSFMGTIRIALDAMTAVIYTFSILFALVVVYMVCSKLFIKERIDIGIYKSLGFTSRSLRLQFAFRFLIIAGVGSILGTILALLFSSRLLNSLLWAMGITNFVASFTYDTVLIPILLICLSFFLFAYLVSGRIKRVEVRELVME